MNTKLIGLVSVTLAMVVLLLTSWGAASARGEEQRLHKVALPDLVQQSVSSSGGPFRRGTAFTVSDTVINDSRVGTPRSATTRYYLSTDTVRSTGDLLLTGARTVPILGPSASSSASVAVTIPSTTPPATYFLLACADDTKLVAESSETNNCRASGTAVVVAP